MLQIHATPLIGATLILLLLICLWWLVVEWSFTPSSSTKHSALIDDHSTDTTPVTATTARYEKQNHHSTAAQHDGSRNTKSVSAKPETSNTNSVIGHHGNLEVATTETSYQKRSNSATAASPDTFAKTATAELDNSTTTRSSKVNTLSVAKASAVKESTNKTKPSSVSKTYTAETKQKTHSKPDNKITSGHRNSTQSNTEQNNHYQSSAKKISADSTTQIETTRPSVHSNNDTTTPSTKYQTAAKAKRPSGRGEASLQIPTATVTGNQPSQTVRKDHQSGNTLADKPNTKHAGYAKTFSPATRSPDPAKDHPVSQVNSPVPHAIKANIHSISVRATSIDKLKSKAKLPRNASAPVACISPQDNIEKNSQSSIEKVVAQKSSAISPNKKELSKEISAIDNLARDNLANANPASANQISENLASDSTHKQTAPINKNTQPSEAPPVVDGDAALRAQLAVNGQQIKTLQSTINHLQDRLPEMATPVAAMPQTHARPTLLSKVRVLDHPKA